MKYFLTGLVLSVLAACAVAPAYAETEYYQKAFIGACETEGDVLLLLEKIANARDWNEVNTSGVATMKCKALSQNIASYILLAQGYEFQSLNGSVRDPDGDCAEAFELSLPGDPMHYYGILSIHASECEI